MNDGPGRPGVTLRHVAAQARVHPSTASRALNGSTRELVNPATVCRILKVAEELGYSPNSLARGLKTNRTFTVGMLVPDLTNPVFPPIVRGIEDRLVDDGYTLVLGSTDGDPEKERRIVDVMRSRRVDGFLLATARREYPLLERLQAADVPVVLINRTAEQASVPSVAPDDNAGIALALRHLVSLGHTRVAHVAGPQSVTTGLARYHSFLAWMQTLGLQPDPSLVTFAEWFTEPAGAVACDELLRRGRDFSAIVAGNDLIALGCYDALADHGRRIPEDVSVIGYNDIPFCANFGPPLTSIRIPQYEIGATAAELMLEVLRGNGGAAPRVHLAPALVPRASTRRARS